MKNQIKLFIKCILLSLFVLTYSCTPQTSTNGPLFIVRCTDYNTIKITATGTFPNTTSSPSAYNYHFSLVDLFQSNVDVSIDRDESIGELENSDGNNTVKFPAELTLTQSDGNISNSYDIVFPSQGTPGNPPPSLIAGADISGSVELELRFLRQYSLNDDVLNCDTEGEVYWGLPGTPVTGMGKWITLCDCPCE